jgi:hypothetical protein
MMGHVANPLTINRLLLCSTPLPGNSFQIIPHRTPTCCATTGSSSSTSLIAIQNQKPLERKSMSIHIDRYSTGPNDDRRNDACPTVPARTNSTEQLRARTTSPERESPFRVPSKAHIPYTGTAVLRWNGAIEPDPRGRALTIRCQSPKERQEQDETHRPPTARSPNGHWWRAETAKNKNKNVCGSAGEGSLSRAVKRLLQI